MSYNIKPLLFSTAIAAIIAVSSHKNCLAEDVGDEYYPSAVEDISSSDSIAAQHDKRMQAIENEYKAKITALEKRYNNEDAGNNEVKARQLLELREKSAQLKEERVRRRSELENEFLMRKVGFEDGEFNNKNQYVINMKERKAYFEKKQAQEEVPKKEQHEQLKETSPEESMKIQENMDKINKSSINRDIKQEEMEPASGSSTDQNDPKDLMVK